MRLSSYILILLFTGFSKAATVTVCSSGCTTTSLQTALNTTATCGDTISIKSTEIQTGTFTFTNRGCTGNPITVTSDRAAWLPLANTRITPSHLANMAILRTTAGGTIVLSGILDGSSLPANNWTFIGIAFTTTASTNFYLVQTKSQSYTAANTGQLPHHIIFDRCYFYMGLPNAAGTALNQGIWIDGSNVTIKNSFFGDIADFTGNEAHPIYTLNTPGPLTIENNYITNSSTSLFAGGDAFIDIPSTVPTNVTFRYNYTYTPWKWNSDINSPYHADYLANGGGGLNVCKKNHGEFKIGDGILWQYNGHENMWLSDPCNGQSYGYTATVRNGAFASSYFGGISQITFSNSTTGSWTGSSLLSNPAGLDSGACIAISSSLLECHALASLAANSLILATPLSSTPAGPVGWFYTYEASGYLANITQINNVYKNVSLGVDNLGTTPSNGVGNAGRLRNIIVSNNLYWNDVYSSTTFNSWFHASAAEEGFNYGPSNYTFTHNTLLAASQMNSYADFHAYGYAGSQPFWDGLNFSNNIAAPSANFPIVGDSTTGNLPFTFLIYMLNSKFQSNGMPGISTASCASSNTCSGNIPTAWSNPFYPGTFKLKTSIYRRIGTDNEDLGVSADKLPMIHSLSVTPRQHTALLTFNLTGPIKDAGSTQPCVLEISTSRNLHSDLDVYSVIIPLDPTKFKQVDASNTTNVKLILPVVTDGRVSWPIGQENAALTDDGGVSRDMRLTPNTLYYGRLMAYGASELFTFTTTSTASVATTRSITQKVPAAYDTLRVEYGTTAAFGSTVDSTPNGTTRLASVSIPLPVGFTYYRKLFRASSVTVVTGPTYVLVN